MAQHVRQSTKRRSQLAIPEIVFLCFALIVGSCIALFLPAGAAFDECFHIARTDQLARGQLISNVVGYGYGSDVHTLGQDKSDGPALWGGVTDRNLFDVAVQNNAHLHTPGVQYLFPAWEDPASHSQDLYAANGDAPHVFSNSALNTPLVYSIFLPGFALGHLMGLSVYWIIVVMRLSGLLIYISCVVLCLRVLPLGKWPLAIIAASPGALSEAATVSADTFTFIACFLLLAAVVQALFSAKEAENRIPWIMLSCAMVLIAFSKMSYVPFMMIIWALPLVEPNLRTKKTCGRLALLTVLSLVCFFSWYAVVRGINSAPMWHVSTDAVVQAHAILTQPAWFVTTVVSDMFARDVFGISKALFFCSYGLDETAIPFDFGFIGTALFALVLPMYGWSRDIDKRYAGFAMLLLIAVACCSFLIYAALYISYTPVGDTLVSGIQARYFLPLILPATMAISLLFHIVRNSIAPWAQKDTFTPAREGVIRKTLTILLVLGILVATWAELRLLFLGVYA